MASFLPRNADGHASVGGDEIMRLYGVLTLLLFLFSKGLARLFHLNLGIAVKTRQKLSLICISGVFLMTWLTLMCIPLSQGINRINIQMPNRLGFSVSLLVLYLFGTGSLIGFLKIQNVMER